MNVPLDRPTFADWRIYADWLADQEGTIHTTQWRRAIRFAVACRENPRLVLLGYDRLRNDYTLVAHGSGVERLLKPRWWTQRYTVSYLAKSPLVTLTQSVAEALGISTNSMGMATMAPAQAVALIDKLAGTPCDFDLKMQGQIHLFWAWYWATARSVQVVTTKDETVRVLYRGQEVTLD